LRGSTRHSHGTITLLRTIATRVTCSQAALFAGTLLGQAKMPKVRQRNLPDLSHGTGGLALQVTPNFWIVCDLPPKFHPVAFRVLLGFTPSGAGGATGDWRSWSGLRARRCSQRPMQRACAWCGRSKTTPRFPRPIFLTSLNGYGERCRADHPMMINKKARRAELLVCPSGVNHLARRHRRSSQNRITPKERR
jgi:hypothetical protein